MNAIPCYVNDSVKVTGGSLSGVCRSHQIYGHLKFANGEKGCGLVVGSGVALCGVTGGGIHIRGPPRASQCSSHCEVQMAQQLKR